MFPGTNNTRLKRKVLTIIDFENGFLSTNYLPLHCVLCINRFILTYFRLKSQFCYGARYVSNQKRYKLESQSQHSLNCTAKDIFWPLPPSTWFLSRKIKQKKVFYDRPYTIEPRNSGMFGHLDLFHSCGVFLYFASSKVLQVLQVQKFKSTKLVVRKIFTNAGFSTNLLSTIARFYCETLKSNSQLFHGQISYMFACKTDEHLD